MNTKPISPKAHGILDYALIAGMLVLPSVFGLSKKVKKIYTVEGLLLLGYAAVSEHPVAVVPLIPYKIHGKVDTINVSQFALQTLLPAFKKDKKATAFNIAFTLLAGAVVALTDWDAEQ